MKKILQLVLIFLVTDCFGQTDSTDIYYLAIKNYIIHLDGLTSIREELIIKEIDGITENFPAHIGTRKIIVLKSQDQNKIYKEKGNQIIQYVINPAKISNDKVDVGIGAFFGEYLNDEKRYSFAISDFIVIQFKYNCNTRMFKYFGIMTGGE